MSKGHPDRDLEITFVLGGKNKGRKFTLPIPTYNLWMVYKAVDKVGVEGSMNIAKTAGIIATLIRRGSYPDPDEALNSVWAGLADLLNISLDEPSLDEPEDEDQVLNFCYVLLKHKRITREQSARIAAALLRWTPAVNAEDWQRDVDAWRKRLDRWVDNRNLPRLGQTKRKPRK